MLDFVHPDDVERSSEALASLGRGQQLSQFENRNIRKDGSVSWLEWNVRPAPEEGVVYAAARDVTDRRRAEEEQAALRRVATLVARGAPPERVFAAVTQEVGRLLPVDLANLCRYEPDGTITFVATWGSARDPFPVGSRWTLGGQNLGTLVFETGCNARIVAAADESRRRIERDLHDGTQQQLVSLILELRGAQDMEPSEENEVRAQLARTAEALDGVLDVELDARGEVLRLDISDDGIGGADPSRGSGLVGLRDRIEALGGTLAVTSPAGNGTTLQIEIPLERQSSAVSPGPGLGEPGDGAP